MADKKSKRREELMRSPKNGWERINAQEQEKVFAFADEYKQFLDAAKTEREAVSAAIILAEKKGFVPFTRGMKLKPGMCVYSSNRGKTLMLAVIGSRPLSEGAAIAAAHVDSPRLDLKQSPLYEDMELAFLKTHYYGGIRKYQWLTIPLELHGVVALKGGAVVDVVIGRDKDDPVFAITDLLPHLAAEQVKKPVSEAFTGESLNVLFGSIPDKEEGEDRVKLAVLSVLREKYGITEEDFLSAELEVVPGFTARDVGLDRSVIGGYGQDDRVGAFASLMAVLDIKKPARTCVCILADKEEIGSEGVSGMKSLAFDCFMEDLCETQGVKLRECFEKSICLSCDVCNGFDPNYPDVSEKRNSARLGYGLSVSKYSGSRGKSGCSDASAETIAFLRRVFDDGGVVWQTAELGKVDQGGGGTVAAYIANRNIECVDAGVAVLSMHSPFELTSKLDVYMTYKGIKAVFADK